RHTCGIVCTPMTRDEARRLHLEPMVADNDSAHGTAFTVSVDYRHGTTTGISADDRCATVRGLANPNSGAADFVRPGHIFPLIAKEGGVLMRSGHTEAAVDLARLAGLPPVGVICELVNDDGTVKRGPEVAAFAEEHGLPIVSVADLIAYRQRQEHLVERVGAVDIDTFAGPAKAVSYSTPWDPMQHLAIVYGDIRDGRDIPVRLHLESVVDDVFGDCEGIRTVMRRIAKGGRGVVVYLREGSTGVAYGEPQRPREDFDGERPAAEIRQEQWREIGLGAQILKDLGISSIRLLASRERHYVGLAGFGIEISATEIMEG
ncbi:MAG: 3,4-dihydroxy-2-butanone-4-phosphate synthase, partial [Hyphomicrobiales bacterium]|nr:3,4-dihydroxy-2-butanone-4-phosphate synthase [Hyphomicrobiales bacterium]